MANNEKNREILPDTNFVIEKKGKRKEEKKGKAYLKRQYPGIKFQVN